MPPLTHTVRFVDHEKVDIYTEQKGNKSVCRQPLRRDIKQFDVSFPYLVEYLVSCLFGHIGVDRRRGNSVIRKSAHLIFHQCDQRRNHHRYPLH